MRLGFVTALTNDFDAKELIQAIAQQEVGVDLEFEQAPTLLNTPAAVKKLFYSGAEACIVFVQSSGEERISLALAQEKIVDVEKDAGKYCIVCTVLDEEENAAALAEERLKEALHLLLGVKAEKPQQESQVDFFQTPSTSLDMFSPSGENESSGGKPLF
ncbi:MAG TPA: hypothetical protein VI875_02115 [Candidatus Norongarragalinales archaeon]|nr:hypothetical protein [Candidatus Norongarragalinales archaeon]